MQSAAISWFCGNLCVTYSRTEAMYQVPTMWIKKEETDEVQTELHSMFLEDQLKTEGTSVSVKQDPELKQHADGSEHNSVKDPLGISWPTDFIKEDPELNLEMNVTENIVAASERYASDSARLIHSTGGSCGTSCEETCHHGRVLDDLEIDREKSPREFGRHKEGIMDKECSVATIYDCSMREKEFHVYSCNFCLQSFPSKYRLIMHVFMHIDGMQPPLYVCKWCGEVFHSNVSLKKHLRMSENYKDLTAANHEKYGFSDKHQSGIFSDRVSEVPVTEHNELSSYKETWKASNRSSNDICNTHMTHDMETTNHYGNLSTAVNVGAQAVLLTASRPHKCGICGKSFPMSGRLKRHELIHTGKKPHKCDICDKSFARSSSLKTHKLIHNGKKPHKCDICDKSFVLSSSLKRHKLIHTGKKPHKCDICDKSFVLSLTLKTHKLIHTGKKPHKSEICGKSFAVPGSLKRHELIHTGKKRHKCEICGKSFAMSDNFKRHELIHTGKKMHKCDICGKSFALSFSLKTHKLIHTGKKPHKCEICDKSFAVSRRLKKHSLIHTGEKPHKCEICGKSFTMSDNLKRHELIHTGRKLHKCDICGKSCTVPSSLKTHELIHTRMKPHKFDICGKSFAV
ncbi:zinc finger protein 708-like isoform X1 [Schistocerca serialis cubense]|uniref:zinc finger protein 708-like isoform X1 n=1 Tax=Schistocerca serialis cubense TaxID=2023355 RepID=UPI00214EB864|nr:zinc finger protein 708-like isoform X1 [Schistocerca serialis cubense]